MHVLEEDHDGLAGREVLQQLRDGLEEPAGVVRRFRDLTLSLAEFREQPHQLPSPDGIETPERRVPDRAAAAEGISVCPETAVCLDTIERLKEMGQIKPGDEVLVFNTGAAQKYLEAVPLSLPRLDKDRPMTAEQLA